MCVDMGGSNFRERWVHRFFLKMGVHRGFTKRGVHRGVHKKGGSQGVHKKGSREPYEPPLATGLCMMCVKANMFTSSLHVLRDSIKDTYILFVFVVSTVDIRASVFLLQNFVNSVSDFAHL